MNADILETIEYYTNIFGIDIFLNGGCGVMARLLKSHYPEALILYDSDHVITKIGDLCYDATGVVDIKNHQPIENEPLWLKFFNMSDLFYE